MGKYTIIDGETPANAEFFNRVHGDFHGRIAALEKAGSVLKAAQDEIVKLGIQRINEVVTPALEALQNIADLSDLFRASSDTSVQIGTGVTEFIIVPGDRVQFAPPLFVSIAVDGQLDKWMVGQVQSWNEETGQLYVNVTHTKGEGTFDDWVVSPANTPDTGPTLDAYTKAEVDSAIAQSKADILGGAPEAALDTLTELADALADDANFAASMTTALAGKSNTGHNHAIEDVTGLQAALDEFSSTAPGEGASLIGVRDASSFFTGDNQEAVNNQLYKPLLHAQYRVATSTDGGSASAATWNPRNVNTEIVNEIPDASVGGGLITLPAGDYEALVVSSVAMVNNHKVRIYNTDDSTTIAEGISGRAQDDDSGSNTAVLFCRFSLAAEKTLRIDHYTQAARATIGLGYATDAGDYEVYMDVQIRKTS